MNLKNVIAVVVLGLSLALGWQIGKWELFNIEFQDDLQDVASQLGTRVGLQQITRDEELRREVIRKASQYDIQLKPSQITVEHMGSGDYATTYLAVDYTVPVELPGISFRLHFTPSTSKKLLFWRKF